LKKKIEILLMLFLCLFTFFACARQIKTSADELTTRNWKICNISGVEATLEFKGDRAIFSITDPNDKGSAVIEGALAVDDKSFYITSEKYSETFEFGYRVFKDRAEITYGAQTLVFIPLENAVPESENATGDEE